MPRKVAKIKDVGVDKEKSVVKKDVVKRSRKMRGGGNDIFFNKINLFITQNLQPFNTHKDAIIKVLENLKLGYNNSIARSVTPSIIDFNKSSRFKNTLKATIDYLNAIGNVNTKDPDKVKFPQYPIVNELADVLLDIFTNDHNMTDEKNKNDFILQFIHIKIYILFIEFLYFCNRINDIKNYNIVEPPNDLKNTKDKLEEDLTAEKEARKKAEEELAEEKIATDAVKAELAAEKKTTEAANAAKEETNRKLKEAEEKYKLLEDKILTIDEDYFKNALDEVKKNINSKEFTKVEKKIKAIIAIWEILRDDSIIKNNNDIKEIIEEIKKLNLENNDKLILSLAGFSSGGKRKINSSRTKRK
jgi:hypothetical protein